MSLSVTAYVTCYGGDCTLAVEALRAQSRPPDKIVTVVDGGPYSSWDLARESGVKLLYHDIDRQEIRPSNLGLAFSCNTALEHCDTDLLMKVDTDVALERTWIERALDHFKRTDIVGVGGRLMESGRLTIPSLWRQQFMMQHYGDKSQQVRILYGADQIFRVKALRDIGGWDGQYKKNYEDVDLCERLTDSGAVLFYDSQMVARHLRVDTLESVLLNHWAWFRDQKSKMGLYDPQNLDKLLARNRGLTEMYLRMGSSWPWLAFPSWALFWHHTIRDLLYSRQPGASTVMDMGLHTAVSAMGLRDVLINIPLEGAYTDPLIPAAVLKQLPTVSDSDRYFIELSAEALKLERRNASD